MRAGIVAAKRFAFVAVLALAVTELVGQLVIRARVVPDEDWILAAGYVREHRGARDLVVGAPAWADPLFRRYAGDLTDPTRAGRSDLAPFDRVWALSIRGATPPELAARAPAEERSFGRVRVMRWDLGPSTVRYDFVDNVRQARVTWADRPCGWRRSRAMGGGIYEGPVVPEERFVCDVEPWRWVGATVMPDLKLAARHCIWAHPSGAEPVRLTFADVPVGDRIVVYGGLSYAQAREPPDGGGPVDIVVRVDGAEVGRRAHRAGDGFRRFEVATTGHGPRGEVTFEVSSAHPYHQTFCFSATSREGHRQGDS